MTPAETTDGMVDGAATGRAQGVEAPPPRSRTKGGPGPSRQETVSLAVRCRRLWAQLCATGRAARLTARKAGAPLVDGKPYSHAGTLATAAFDGLIQAVAPDTGTETPRWVLLVATRDAPDHPALRRQIGDALMARHKPTPVRVQFVILPGLSAEPVGWMVARLATEEEAWADTEDAGTEEAGTANGAPSRGPF